MERDNILDELNKYKEELESDNERLNEEVKSQKEQNKKI